MWQRGIRVGDEIKVAGQVNIKWRDYPGLWGVGGNVITRVLKVGGERQKRRVRERHVMIEMRLERGCVTGFDWEGPVAKESGPSLGVETKARKGILP